MRPARDVLVLPALAFALGIVSADALPPAPWLSGAGIAALSVVLAWSLHQKAVHGTRLALWTIFLLSGALAADLRRPGPPPIIDFQPGEILLLSGCIVQPVESDAVRTRFVLELDSGAHARVSLTARDGETLPQLSLGNNVEVEAKLRTPRNFGNPGAFDYVGFLRRHDVYWTASARGISSIKVLPGQCGSAAARATARTRELISRRVSELFSPEWPEARLLPALLIGSNGSSDRTSTEDFRRTGTYHALVVSGLHIAVVAGGILTLLRWLALPLWIILPTAAATAWVYAAVCNWQPPAVRSAAGFTLFLMARWFFRRGRVLNLLGAVVLAILALDAQAVYDPSFQLTVLSVGAIGGLALPVTERLIAPVAAALRRLGNPDLDAKHPDNLAELRIELRLIGETFALLTRSPARWWTRAFQAAGTVAFWAAETALISACIQLALAVPMVVYFHRLSVTSVLANLTVSPALSIAVPAAFLACLTGLTPLVQFTRLLLWWSYRAVEFWSSLEPEWRTPDPPLALSVLVLGACTAFAACLCLRASRLMTGTAGALALTALTLLCVAPFSPDIVRGELELTVIDVGQGDSLLVVSPEGRTLLVDGGGIPTFDPRFKPALEIGEDVVSPYLWRRGFPRLDYIAVTHLHADHANGLPALIRNFRPAELWTGAVGSGSVTDEVVRAAQAAGTRILHLRAGARPDFGSAQVSVLAPYAGYAPGASPSNSDSLVLRVAYGARSFLLTGDADRRVEEHLLNDPSALQADVLKVGHHGSRTSTSPAFLAAVSPLFAAISTGADNFYGHPHSDVLGRLNAAGCRAWRTDNAGLVSFFTNGKRIRVNEAFFRAKQP